VPLMDAEGEISWQERLNEQGSRHPSITEIDRVLEPLHDTRLNRASQFLKACLVRGITIPAATELEQQLDECVKLIRNRGLAGERP